MSPAEQASLALRAPSSTFGDSPYRTVPRVEPAYPRRRAAATLHRLAADHQDEGSPSERADAIYQALVVAALAQRTECTERAIGLFLSAVRFAGFSTQVAVEALERVYDGGAMPWDPDLDKPIEITITTTVEVRS